MASQKSLLERFAAYGTWAVVAGLCIYGIARSTTYKALLPATIVLLVLYAAFMAAATVSSARTPPATWRHIALWLQLASALALGCLVPVDFLPILSIIWIAIVPAFYGSRVSIGCLIGVTLAWYAIKRGIWDDSGALITAMLYSTFHVFALIAARIAKEAQRAQQRAERLNSELIATQHLLSEASRQSERTRIARDLHDLLGHHLTALSINLQIAERTVNDDAREVVSRSRALARLLLSDVRDAVSDLRERNSLDFRESLRILVDSLVALKVTLAIDDNVQVEDIEVAETLLRVAQEGTTNALRHSGANALWLTISQTTTALTLTLRDNGTTSLPLREGNGLTGMRERVAAVNGELRLEAVAKALQIRVTIPLPYFATAARSAL